VAGRVTLQTIADALGVSRTTVSNAYNRPDQLAPELRERILDTARRLGYAGPDAAARRLRTGRAEAVGLLFTEDLSYAFTDPAAVLLLQGIARATEAARMPVLIIPSLRGHDEDGQSAVRDAVVRAFCIYSMPEDSPDVNAALERRLPIVVVDEPRLDGHSYVGIDDRAGERLAAQHLLGLGHRRIGVLSERTAEGGYSGPLSPEREAAATYPITRERLGGAREALEAAGIDWTGVPKHECLLNAREEGRAGAEALLTRDPTITALICQTDQIALGALAHVGDRGISVVGFDDIPAAERADLTTIRQPLLEKGLTAGRLLTSDGAPQEVRLPVELIARGSTRPA
jgi:DNA-binding LacI/PurR family transcriptional regulator